jgi:hypothetical protein
MAAKLTLQSTQKLLSGYQIPVLGYGVRHFSNVTKQMG